MGNIILRETAEKIESILGNQLNDLVVERAVFGLFFSGVKLNTGHGGTCFTPIKDMPEAVCCPSSAKAMPLSGRLENRKVIDYLDDLEHKNILRKTLAIAVLNALSMLCWENRIDTPYKTIYDADTFDMVDIPSEGKSIVIGALVPMIKKLIQSNADFKILEKDIRTLKGKELEYFVSQEDAYKYIPKADLLVITGTTLLNDTLPDILDNIKPGADVIVTGPTVSMLPDAFFKHGVSMLGGIQVTNTDELLSIISQAGSGYHFFGKSATRVILKK